MKRLLALVLIAMFLVGCTGGGGGGGGTITIGLVTPLTGDVKTFGESTKAGFELALEHAGNKAGNWTIKTIVQDDKNDPNEGVNIATKMITQDGVKAIVGSVTSKVSIPVAEVANANGVVSITGTGTNEFVTVDEATGARKPFAFRACFIDPFQGQVGAAFALNTIGAKRAAVLYDKGNDYTVGLAENFRKNFEAGGGQIVAWESYSQQDTDFSAVMTNVAAQNPDFLYLPDYYNKVSLIANAAKDKGLNVAMMGGDGWDSSDLDFAALNGGYFTNHYSPDDDREEVQKFVEAYKAKTGEVPDALAALAYDATNLLLEAIKQANSDDSDKIRAAMQNIKNFKTVSGEVSFDENGNPVKSAAILQVDAASNSYKFVESVKP